MKLTKTDLAAIYRACEDIDLGLCEYSCIALDIASCSTFLSEMYTQFYRKPRNESWWPSLLLSSPRKRRLYKNERIMALLFFIEVNK